MMLLQYDHREDEEKTDCVSSLFGSAREAEVQKTDCKCAWHHFMHTRVQMGYTPDGKYCTNTGLKLQLRKRKEKTGCQHPLHKGMPYSSLVPSSCDDPLVYGFLDVSHVRLGRTASKTHGEAQLLADLDSGAAVIHCKFCHFLYTVCENAMKFSSAKSQYYFSVLLRKLPAFVQHFDESTAGFDWDLYRSERQRPRVKRKAELPDPSPTMFEYGAEDNRKRVRIEWKRATPLLKSAVAQIISPFFEIVDDDSA